MTKENTIHVWFFRFSSIPSSYRAFGLAYREPKSNNQSLFSIVVREWAQSRLFFPISLFLFKVKINGTNEEMLRNAAEQFGSKDTDEIMFVARETLEGHQRAIMGNMTVEEIYR